MATDSIPSPYCARVRLHAPTYTVNQTYTDQSVRSAMQTFYICGCLSPSASFLLSSSVDSPFSLTQNSLRARACRGQRAKLTQPSIGIFYGGERVCVCVSGALDSSVALISLQWNSELKHTKPLRPFLVHASIQYAWACFCPHVCPCA